MGSRDKRLALFFRISVRMDKGRAWRGVGIYPREKRECERVGRISRRRWKTEENDRRRRRGERVGRKREMPSRAAARREENGEGQVFMGTHNSCPLLKLPSENGLRRLAQNLSKFPERVIYSCSAAPYLPAPTSFVSPWTSFVHRSWGIVTSGMNIGTPL